jgi:hypothetical protein
VRAQASLGDRIKDFFERTRFEKWAPKSSRAWRLRQYPSEVVPNQDISGALCHPTHDSRGLLRSRIAIGANLVGLSLF